MPEKFVIDMRKEFYTNMQKFLKKHNINHYSTYSVMKARSLNSSYIEKRYVETIYAQWKLQMDRLATFRVRVQRKC